MRPWNPLSITFDGRPVTGRVPAGIRVLGPDLTGQQMGMVQAAFASFCDRSRLSVVQNTNEHGLLPDGSAYQITVINGIAQMVVWTAPVHDETAEQCGVFLEFTNPANPFGAKLYVVCFPSGEFGSPDGKWKAKYISRYHAPPSNITTSNSHPTFAGESWHPRTGKEYYVTAEDQALGMERGGRFVLLGDYEVIPGELSRPAAPVAKLEIGSDKMFCQINYSSQRSIMVYTPSFDTSTNKTVKPIHWTGRMDILDIGEPPADGYASLEGMTANPAGDKLLAISGSLDMSVYPTAYPGTKTIKAPVHVEYELAHQSGTTYSLSAGWTGIPGSKQVQQYAFNGAGWSPSSVVLESPDVDCDPWAYVTRTLAPNYGGFYGEILVTPTATASDLPGATCPIWYFPEPQPRQNGIDVLAITGGHSYKESNRYGALKRLFYSPLTGTPTGAWFTHDDTPYVAYVDTTASWSMTSTGDTDSHDVRDLACQNLGYGDFKWMELDEFTATATQTSDFTRRRLYKQTFKLGIDEVVLSDNDISEMGTYKEDYVSRGVIGEPLHRKTTYTVHANLDGRLVERRILAVDPQFRMLCYMEAEIAFSRTSDAQQTVTRNETTGENDIVTTGGDGDYTQSSTGYLVIKIAGSEQFKVAIPSDREAPPPTGSEKFVVDCSIPWGMDEKVNLRQVTGTQLKYLLDYNIWPVDGKQQINAPIFGGPTLSVSMYPLYLSGSQYLTADYAKDPKTGAGVLSISGTNHQTGQSLSYTFTVDSNGLRALSWLVPEADGTLLISQVAAT